MFTKKKRVVLDFGIHNVWDMRIRKKYAPLPHFEANMPSKKSSVSTFSLDMFPSRPQLLNWVESTKQYVYYSAVRRGIVLV